MDLLCFLCFLVFAMPLGKTDLLALVCGVQLLVLSLSHWYLGSGLVLDCIDS